MASQQDVQIALAQLAEDAIYPNGKTNPSIANVEVKIVEGFPVKDQLDKDLFAGKAQVSIFAPPGMERNTTRYPVEWQKTQINTATLSLEVNATAQTITVSGTVTVPQACMVIINKTSYAYIVQQNDTLNSIADAIAGLIPNASANNNIITLQNTYKIIARVTVAGKAARPLKQQERVFEIITWAPSPPIREMIASALDVALAATYRLALSDGFWALLTYMSTKEWDMYQKTGLYRRDLIYKVEYSTTQTKDFYSITDAKVNLTTDI